MSDRFNFTVILEPQPDGGFTVSVPALPEVVTEGDTEAEAMAMAEDAIAPASRSIASPAAIICWSMLPIPGGPQPCRCTALGA